jgi:dTDP-4-amino-4,6-dideoxygalactose transaminase
MKYKMKYNPFSIVKMFEEEVANYTNAPYAVAVDSCTNALFLCCKYLKVAEVIIPQKTYLSVPQSIIHAGGKVKLEQRDWAGIYDLKPYPIYDAALRFTTNMYIPNSLMCLSFHYKKHLPIGKGGMILTDDINAAEWFKRARYEGRAEKGYWEDEIKELGWNMYMTPMEAAIGLSLMQNINVSNADLVEENGYRNLSDFLSSNSFQ